MSGSYDFLVHIIAFGMLAGTFIPSYILDRKLQAEPDWGRKMYIGGLLRTFGMFVPINAGLLLITGIGNIYNRFMGSPDPWYSEGWLVAKLICFVVLLFNGAVIARKLAMSRGMLIKALAEKSAAPDSEQKVAALNKKITMIFAIQTLLLLTILYLSVFGSGKHPGVF